MGSSSRLARRRSRGARFHRREWPTTNMSRKNGRARGRAAARGHSARLLPTLSSGDVVIMDLGSHKGAGVRKAIEAVGATLRYLPPYSSDSTRSKGPSRSSKRFCACLPREPLTPSGMESAPCSTSSSCKDAPTAPPPPATSLAENKPPWASWKGCSKRRLEQKRATSFKHSCAAHD